MIAGLLLLCGSLILIFAARSFKDIRLNLALVLTACLFMGQATVMLNQVRVNQTAQSGPSGIVAQQGDPSDATQQQTPQSGSEQADSSAPVAWDQGGTLMSADLGQWRLGDYSDRLASAASLLKNLRQERLFTASIRSDQDYRPWAAALVACLEVSSSPDQSAVLELARTCTRDDGLKPYLQ